MNGKSVVSKCRWSALLVAFSCASLANAERIVPMAQADVPAVVVTKKERQEVCNRYEGRHIGYYTDLYRVEACQRRRIESADLLFEFMRKGGSIEEVEARVIEVLPEGRPLLSLGALPAKRGCKELNQTYVTLSNVDLFFVENCQKRRFADWETYYEHRRKRGDPIGRILVLTEPEFYAIAEGAEIESLVLGPQDLSRVLDGSAGVDVIPLAEACRGLEGRFAAYYSRLYKIEKCRKREIDSDVFMAIRQSDKSPVIDMSSEQWLSIPDGEPIL